MNEQRTQAYLNLINQLLSCNDGDEPRILQGNEELLDQGLIEVMVAVARQYEEAGNENQARWLMNIARQLAQALGLLDNNPTESANTTQDYLKFLMETLQKISENPSHREIYPFLVQNKDKLNDDLITILESWSKGHLLTIEAEESKYIAAAIFNLSNRIREFPLGNIATNLEIAIAGYQIALNIFTLEASPQDWALVKNNLANAYLFRRKGDKAENIEKAIAFYQEALKVRTLEAFPLDWAATQNNLASAYVKRIKGDEVENIEKAITLYQEALKVRTFKEFPQDWADTQNNLSIAYPG